MNTTYQPDNDLLRFSHDRPARGFRTPADDGRTNPPPPSRRRLYWGLLAGGLIALAGGTVGLFLLANHAAAPLEKKPEPPMAKRTEIKKNLYLEIQGDQRRVIVVANVCLDRGQLEGLMCRKNTKEHEYILTTDVKAWEIHTALLAAKAKAGSPVQYAPKYVPANGSPIKVTLQYKKDGKVVTVPAHDWIRDVKTGKAMTQDWVFAGSRFFPDPDDEKKQIYLAEQGDVICVCNMESAMMDLPVRSPTALEDRVYEAFTEHIPPKDTKVEVILEVMGEKK